MPRELKVPDPDVSNPTTIFKWILALGSRLPLLDSFHRMSQDGMKLYLQTAVISSFFPMFPSDLPLQ